MPSYLSPGVYVEEVESGSRPIEGVGTAVAAFVGFAQQGPFDEPTLITNWSQFVSVFGDFVEGTYLATSVYGYFANGGGQAYVVRIGRGGESAEPAQARLGPYTVRVLPGVTGEIGVEIVHPEEDDADDGLFTLLVRRDGEVAETFDAVSTKRNKDNVATRVKARSQLIRLEAAQRGALAVRPEAQSVVLPAAAGDPPPELSADTYVGDPDRRTGLGGLEAVEEVTMVAVPDLMSAYQRGDLDAEAVVAVQQGLIAHCEAMGDRIAILDPLPGLSPQQVRTWRTETTGFDSKYAALYYPWIKVLDLGLGRNVFVPPSGHIAGVWARNDDSRGVHKAPANEVIRGAVALETQLTKGEQDLLNPIGVNCVRLFAGRGIRVWGPGRSPAIPRGAI